MPRAIRSVEKSCSLSTRKLLKLVYTSIIRSHLEYSSALIHCAAPTHLAKLDTVQKIASRIITNSDSRAHSAPLETLLGLESLDSRRKKHISDIVADIQRNDSHPYFQDFFKDSIHNSLENKTSSVIAKKRFVNYGLKTYNETIQPSYRAYVLHVFWSRYKGTGRSH